MKKPRAKKLLIAAAVLLVFVVVYLVYSRPMTIQQRYPMLTPEKCVELRGYYRVGAEEVLQEVTIDKNSEEFAVLFDLLYEQEYRRSLRNLVSGGTRVHVTEPEDFQWEVLFFFEDVVLPDGSIGSGTMLQVQNWYGELGISFDGEQTEYDTDGQEEWAKEILSVIQ